MTHINDKIKKNNIIILKNYKFMAKIYNCINTRRNLLNKII